MPLLYFQLKYLIYNNNNNNNNVMRDVNYLSNSISHFKLPAFEIDLKGQDEY